MQFVKPTPYREAVEKIGTKSPIGSKLSSSEWADVPVQLRERATFSSRVESVRFLGRAQESIGDFLRNHVVTLPNGKMALATGGRAQFIEQMRQMALREGMGQLGEKRGGLQDITSERRLGLIFDTLTQQAGDYGYRKQGLDPDVLNEFPAQRFIRVKAVKERRNWHVQFEGEVFLKTDPIWRLINYDFGVPWGPWGWGCGHDVEDVDRQEAEDLGLIAPGQQIEAPTEDFNQELEASTKGLAPELIDKLKAEFGDRITVEGETIRWNSEAVGREIALGQGALRQHPISDALDLKIYGAHKESIIVAMGAIEKVHDTSMLPKLPVTDTKMRAFGLLRLKESPSGQVTAEKMAVRSDGPWPALTAVHETGHYLDLQAIGPSGDMASYTDPEMLAVIAAAEQTAAVQGLRLRMSTTRNPDARDHYAYLLTPHEIWARAYAQFITEKSGYGILQRELQLARDAEKHRQWQTEDFKPIATAIEKLLGRLGWL